MNCAELFVYSCRIVIRIVMVFSVSFFAKRNYGRCQILEDSADENKHDFSNTKYNKWTHVYGLAFIKEKLCKFNLYQNFSVA